jgi:hypothetical protein
MRRRELVQLIAASISGSSKISGAAAFDCPDGQRSLTFFVSGARFLGPVQGLKVGDPVEIKEEVFNAAPCYSVNAQGARKLGYVPRKLIPIVEKLPVSDARLCAVDLGGVPWKRYEVKVYGQPR